MKELGEALKVIFTKLGDFFDIFDLSFFISGTVLFMAVLYLGLQLGLVAFADWSKAGLLFGLVVLMAIYVSGLVSFSMGRWLRGMFYAVRRKQKAEDYYKEKFLPIIYAHGLDQNLRFAEYFQRNEEHRAPWRLYTRLWAELRHCDKAAPSRALLMRYWVMAATCDGLGAAFFIWAGVLVWRASAGANGITMLWLGAIILSAMAVLVLREANRYQEYQWEELVASLAAVQEGNKAITPEQTD